MSPEHFSQLLEKYLQDNLSADELAQFLAAAREKIHQPVIRAMLAQKLARPSLYKVSGSGELDDLFERMLVKTGETAGDKRLVKPRYIKLVRYAAAAVILFAAGVGTYFYLYRQPAATAIAATPVHTVAPGRDGAILTLADGKTIVLDSLGNGIVTTQDGATISMKEGRLAYHVAHTGYAAGVYNTISTPRGRQFQVVLSDGTRIWLNAASSIKFPTAFAGKERRVELSGEAYLEVAQNPRQPFRVVAHGTEVRVLGTVFNISAYEDESTIRTTLLEGSIKISFPRSTGGRKELLLKPGDQVNINRAGDADLVKEAVSELDAAVAWKNGVFLMKGADVTVIMRQIARWYNIQVRFEGPVPEGRISGELPRSMELQKLLEVIKASGIAIAFRWEGDKLVVSRQI